MAIRPSGVWNAYHCWLVGVGVVNGVATSELSDCWVSGARGERGWRSRPRLEPGPGEAPILRNLKFDSRDHERRVRDVERHREVLRRNLATRVAARTNLEIMSSQRFPG